MITITEQIEVFQSANGDHASDGQEMLTCTVWADDEPLKEFGGCVMDHDDVRNEALSFARKCEGTTGEMVRQYDAFIRKMDACEWDR